MLRFAKIGAILLLSSSLSAFADNLTFNFENQPSATSGGALASFSETVNGVTMTVTRVGGNGFDIVDLSSLILSSDNWGNRTLSPFADTSNSAFIFTFSQPVSSFSIQLGDFDADSDTQTLSAFSGANGTGSLLSTGGFVWGDGDISSMAPQTDSLSAAGIQSVTVIGGSANFPNSLYYDNVMVTTPTTTPEPSSLLLLLTGAGGLAGLRLRRRFA